MAGAARTRSPSLLTAAIASAEVRPRIPATKLAFIHAWTSLVCRPYFEKRNRASSRKLLRLVSRPDPPRVAAMKTTLAALLLSFVCWSESWAQVLVEVRLDQEQYLPGETLLA